MRITYTGQAGDLIVNGGLEDPQTGYSANIPFAFSSPGTVSQSMRYAQLDLMTGAADPMLHFPVGTVFTPYSVVRNTSDQDMSIRPTIYWMKSSAPRSAQLPAMTLPARHSANLNLLSLLAAANLPSFNGSINLALDVQGPAHALLVAGGSVDVKNTYVFAVRAGMVKESVAKELSYWSTGNGNDTMVAV